MVNLFVIFYVIYLNIEEGLLTMEETKHSGLLVGWDTIAGQPRKYRMTKKL